MAYGPYGNPYMGGMPYSPYNGMMPNGATNVPAQYGQQFGMSNQYGNNPAANMGGMNGANQMANGGAQAGPQLVMVTSVSQVEQVPVSAGQSVLVMAQNEPYVASRVADNVGLISTDYYMLTKVSNPNTTKQEALVPAANYVLRDEFEERLATIAQAVQSATSTQNQAVTYSYPQEVQAPVVAPPANSGGRKKASNTTTIATTTAQTTSSAKED